jgi:hypothetical protein
MENKFKCQTCEGEGWIPKPDSHPHHGITIDCPDCNNGYMMLAVECEECEGEGGISHAVSGGTVSTDMACNAGMPEIAGMQMSDEWELVGCERCQTHGNRPLTSEDIEELVKPLKPRGTTQYDPVALLIDNVRKGKKTFKGNPVRLVPYREEG